jgi:hypothetical protein
MYECRINFVCKWRLFIIRDYIVMFETSIKSLYVYMFVCLYAYKRIEFYVPSNAYKCRILLSFMLINADSYVPSNAYKC